MAFDDEQVAVTAGVPQTENLFRPACLARRCAFNGGIVESWSLSQLTQTADRRALAINFRPRVDLTATKDAWYSVLGLPISPIRHVFRAGELLSNARRHVMW